MATAAAPCRSPDSPTGSTCGSSSSSTWRCSSSSICCPEPAVTAPSQDEEPYL